MRWRGVHLQLGRLCNPFGEEEMRVSDIQLARIIAAVVHILQQAIYGSPDVDGASVACLL